MRNFPYVKILKKSYQLTLKNPWLWFFGLFIGGFSGDFYSGFGVEPSVPANSLTFDLALIRSQIFEWIAVNSIEFLIYALLGLSVFLIFVVLQGLSLGAIIWTAGQEQKAVRDQDKEGVKFRIALKRSKLYFSKIVGLQFALTLATLALLTVFGLPVAYLFSVGATTRAILLIFLGAILFVPAVLIFVFSSIFGPILIVLYEQKVRGAVSISIKLIRKKFWPSMALVFFLLLIGLFVGAVSGLIFLLLTLLGLGLTVLTAQELTNIHSIILFFGPILIAFTCVIVLQSAFAVFGQTAWVLAVKEMMADLELKEKPEEFARESTS